MLFIAKNYNNKNNNKYEKWAVFFSSSSGKWNLNGGDKQGPVFWNETHQIK